MPSVSAHAEALSGFAWRNETSFLASHTESSFVPPYRPGTEPAMLVICPGAGMLVGNDGRVELSGSLGEVDATESVNGLSPRVESGSAQISEADTGSLPDVATRVMPTTRPMSASAATA